MQEVSYRVDKRKYSKWLASIWLPPYLTKLAVAFTIGLGVLLFVFDHWIIVSIIILAIVLLWVVKALSHPPPLDIPIQDPGPLRFDEEGLYWCDLKGPFQWLWSELSRFEIGQDKKTGQIRIRFDVPDDERFDRVSRWVFRRPSRRIHGLIADIYEAPLEEVADNLNNYRNRALMGQT